MGMCQQGRNAGGWKGTAIAGTNIIEKLKENEKTFAENHNKTFVEDAFHIADISIEAPAGSTFSINNGTTITIPNSGIYHNATSVIKYLIFNSSVQVNIAYCW